MSDDPRRTIDLALTLPGVLGFETLETGPDSAVGRFEVTDRVRQPMGVVHGGAYAAMAEGLTSMATFEAVFGDGNMALGQSNQTSFLRPIMSGWVLATARVIHRGRTSWVWEVEFTDDGGQLCAVTRMTIAVRALPDRAAATS